MDLQQILDLWMSGGWVMIPLLALSLIIYGISCQLFVYFQKRTYLKYTDQDWIQWVAKPSEGQGELGEIIRYTQDGADTEDSIRDRFTEVILSKVPGLDRRLNLLNTLVATAPLMGLLGTVLGMLTTFSGIATGGGKTIDLISGGISEALITTEMGLLIAIPGYFFSYLLKRKRDEMETFLVHVETVTLQRKFTSTSFDDQTPTSSPQYKSEAPGDLQQGEYEWSPA